MIQILVIAKINREVQQIVGADGITRVKRNQRRQNKIRFGVVPGKGYVVVPTEGQRGRDQQLEIARFEGVELGLKLEVPGFGGRITGQ